MAIGTPQVVWDEEPITSTDPMTSDWVQVGGFQGYSFHAWLGSSDTEHGTIKIQIANDKDDGTAVDLEGSDQGSSNSGTDKFDKDNAYLMGENQRVEFWARLHFTPSAATGTVSAVVSKWGP